MARGVAASSVAFLLLSALSFSAAPASVAALRSVAITNAVKKVAPKKAVVKVAAGNKPVAKPAPKSFPTTTMKRKSVVLGTLPTPPTTTVPTTLAPPALLAPLPTSTTTIVTTTIPATTVAPSPTSVASVAPFDFDLQIPSPRVSVNMGSSAAMLVLVLPRGVPRPVDLFFADLPSGVTATGTPNPTTGGSEVRLNAASLMLPGEYQLRVMVVGGSVTKFVAYSLTVLAPGASAPAGSSASGSSIASTTTTTTIPSGSGAFTFVVTSDGKKLKTGGSVTLTAVITPSTNFAGSATLRLVDPPEGVWVGYSQNPSAGTSSIWLSSTVALKAGSYQLLVEAKTSTQTTQLPVLLVIE